jgi:hypothetical protein
MTTSFLLIPDNSKKNLKRSLYHIARFTKKLLEKNESFEVVIVDDNTCDIFEEVQAFRINYFWKIVRPHYQSLEKNNFNKLYNFHSYSEKIGFENCVFDKIIKISGSTIPIQNTLEILYENQSSKWNLIDVYGIDPALEDKIDLHGIFFPKEILDTYKSNPMQTKDYLKYKRPIFGSVKKDNYWTNDYSFVSDNYAFCSLDKVCDEEPIIHKEKFETLKEKIEISSNIYDNH